MDDPELTPAGDAAPPQPVAAPLDAQTLLSRGDHRGAIAALMDVHGDAVFGFCVRMLGDRALADDVLQQVFLEAFRDLGRYQGRSSLYTWLIGIANHRCRDAIKSRGRRERRFKTDEHAMLESVDPESAPHDRLEQSRRSAALEDCLKTLSDEVRMSVVLRFYSGLTYDEISEIQGARADALHARVSRALPALRRCLEAKGWKP